MRLRDAARRHGAALSGYLLMLLVFSGFTVGIKADLEDVSRAAPFPREPIDLPAPENDADGDTYADEVDRHEGDLVLRLHLEPEDLLRADAGYVLVGTQHDHTRFGSGSELQWRHVVDHDPLGHNPGSPEWAQDALRTGAWARLAHWEDRGAPGWTDATLNVREDQSTFHVRLEAWTADTRPHRLQGSWDLIVDTAIDRGWLHRADGASESVGPRPLGGPMRLPGSEARLVVEAVADLGEVKQEIAERWAPLLLFDSGERFFPTTGGVMEQFHGIVRREPDLRTWTRQFNNGRDTYRLLLADFDGDGAVDHRDAAVMTDVLRAGDVASDSVHAHVMQVGDRIVVQYWFLYGYNFVLDVDGRPIAGLAHAGDREFIQLVFASLDDASNGMPEAVAYSQHYGGIVVRGPERGLPPFHVDPERPAVYAASGSHASYPVAGSNAALRPAFLGYGDDFDGEGETWRPEDYGLEMLGNQSWHAGYLWGPATRFSRDLGTSTKPLLQHDFQYPFFDPLSWMAELDRLEARELERLYGEETRDR